MTIKLACVGFDYSGDVCPLTNPKETPSTDKCANCPHCGGIDYISSCGNTDNYHVTCHAK